MNFSQISNEIKKLMKQSEEENNWKRYLKQLFSFDYLLLTIQLSFVE